MGRAAVTLVVATVLSLNLTGAPPIVLARDPFAAMHALRVVKPVLAPDVAFRTLEGHPTRLGELRGRPVLLTFFTTW